MNDINQGAHKKRAYNQQHRNIVKRIEGKHTAVSKAQNLVY